MAAVYANFNRYASGLVLLLLLIYCLIYFPVFVGVLCLSIFCYAFLCVHFSFAIILKRKRVALLLLSCRCIVTLNVLWLFLTVPWIGLQYVIVVFPDHIRLLFGTIQSNMPPGHLKIKEKSYSTDAPPSKCQLTL